MKTIFVTKKAENSKVNPWKAGQKITVHEKMAQILIDKGFATETQEQKPKEESVIEETKKTKKKI